LSAFLGLIPFLIALIYSALLVFYAANLKKQKWIGNIVVASATGITLVFGAAIAGITSIVIILAIAAFLANLAREIIKDAADLEADKGVKETLPMKFSQERLEWIILGLYVSAIAISYILFFMLGFGKSMYGFFVTGANLGFLLSYQSFKLKDFNKAHKQAKVSMSIALLAFLWGGLGL